MKLQSTFAIVDVQRGRVGLEKQIKKKGKVKILLVGYLDQVHGDDDGTSKEFQMDVKSIEVLD